MAPGPNVSREPSSPLPPEVAARVLDFVERTADLFGVADDEGRVIYLNAAARRVLGVDPDGPEPVTTADLFTPDAFETYFEEVRPAILRGEPWSGEVKARTAAGEAVDVWVTIVGGTGPAGEVTWLVTSARDISHWLAAKEELSRRATHDELTDLPGRTVLREHIDLALNRARRTGGRAAVLFVDLNDLKVVNDRLGHHAGDDLLVEVARRLQRAVRTIDTVARVGGDEFVVLLDGIAPEARPATLATRIQAAVETAPARAGDAVVNVSVSIGVAVSGGEPGIDSDLLIRRADLAMYDVKRDRHRRPAPGTGAPVDAEDLAVHDVAIAVTQRAVRPWYQPVVRLGPDGVDRVEGFQVLARWVLPDGAVLPAAEFVPGIDGTGVALSADLAVLREATRALAALDRTPPPRLWVPLSSRSLRTPGADHFVHQALEHARLLPSRLSLEVADDLIVSGDERIAEAVAALRDLGVRLVVSVADRDRLRLVQQTGLAGLLDEVRLGRAFVGVLRESPEVLSAVVAECRALGRRVHLCGIESAGDLDRAAALGIDLAAGFHLGHPEREPAA